MQRTYFKEEQYFSNPWFWVFLIVVFTISLAPIVVPIYSELVLNKPHGQNPDAVVTLLIILTVLTIIYIAVVLLFRKMRLIVEIRNEGLFYRYPPFILKDRHFLKEEIANYKIRKYKPIREYNGWGLQNSWGKSGKAYNVKGNIGLQLYLKDGKRVLFGTQRGDALLRAMNKMMKGE
jgi:hypothetical protein